MFMLLFVYPHLPTTARGKGKGRELGWELQKYSLGLGIVYTNNNILQMFSAYSNIPVGGLE
jgi:hypothetical protein